MWQLSLLNYIARISAYICLLFQDQMINDLHEMLFYSTHAMLSDAITFTSYDMTPSILSLYTLLYEYLYAMLLFQDQTICYDGTSSMHMLFYRNKYATWMKWLHEWNDFTIWHDYLFLLCTCFFFRNQYATWMICLSHMTLLETEFRIVTLFHQAKMQNVKYFPTRCNCVRPSL